MKKVLIIAFIFFYGLTNAQTFVKFNEQDIYDCSSCPVKEGTPTFSSQNYPVINDSIADFAFAFLKKKTKIEFRYTQGSCDDRAHMMSLILDSLKIPNFKIWNFAPAKFSLTSKDLLEVDDKYGYTRNGKIKWGYHVAVATYLENNNGGKDTIVFDPSLFDKKVKYMTWLEPQGKNSFYTFLDSKWYLFYTLNNFTAWDNQDLDGDGITNESLKIPNWFPSILTGDFFVYQGNAKQQHWVSQGLALNDVAYEFYLNELYPILNSESELLTDYKTLVGNIHNFEIVIINNSTNNEISQEFKNKYINIITKYQEKYLHYLDFWTKREKELTK